MWLFFIILALVALVVSFLETAKNLLQNSDSPFIILIFIIMGMFLGYFIF